MFTLSLNGACSIGIANLAAGHSFTIKLTQSNATAPTISSAYKWPGGVTPTWSTTATKDDVIACASFDGTTLMCNGMLDGGSGLNASGQVGGAGNNGVGGAAGTAGGGAGGNGTEWDASYGVGGGGGGGGTGKQNSNRSVSGAGLIVVTY